MSRGYLWALCVAIAGASYSFLNDLSVAQQTYGEYRSECIRGEITVWSMGGDLQLSRGETKGAEVRTSSEIIWFCGGNRREFFCENSSQVNFVEVQWQESGEVTFRCQRR